MSFSHCAGAGRGDAVPTARAVEYMTRGARRLAPWLGNVFEKVFAYASRHTLGRRTSSNSVTPASARRSASAS